MPKPSATCACCWRESPASCPARCASAWSGAAEAMQFETGGQVSRPDLTVEQLEREAAHGGGEGDDIDVIAITSRIIARREPVPHARRQGAGPARILLGGLGRSGIFGAAAGEPAFLVGDFFSALLKQLYLDAPYVPRRIYIPVDFEDRAALEELLSEKPRLADYIEVPQRGRQALADRSGREQRQAILRSALPRDEAENRCDEERCRRMVFCLPDEPIAHRVLRHFAHPGRGDRRHHGGVGRRQDEERRTIASSSSARSKALTISSPCTR